MFHRRYAAQTAQSWARYLSKGTLKGLDVNLLLSNFFLAPNNKKIPLIYLANEVVQQSRARRKDEFITAFATVLPNSLEQVYTEATVDSKNKIKRVVQVWGQRQVFPKDVLEDIDSRISESKRPRKGSGGTLSLGPFSGIPPQLLTLSSLQKTEADSAATAESAVTAVSAEYAELFDSDALPAPPVYAGKLTKLHGNLTNTSLSLKSLVTNRRGLVDELRRLVKVNETALTKAQSQMSDIEQKLAHTLETKQEVESMLVEIDDSQQIASSDMKEPSYDDAQPSETNYTAEDVSENTPATEVVEEYSVQSFDNSMQPSYSPLSSDDEDDEPQAKKQKTDTDATTQEAPAIHTIVSNGLEGLDPKVAEFLETMAKASNLNQ
jgi:regulator of Ty1 transposition protein 103